MNTEPEDDLSELSRDSGSQQDWSDDDIPIDTGKLAGRLTHSRNRGSCSPQSYDVNFTRIRA